MIETHAATGASVIACKEFPPEQISAYGCVAYEPAGDRLLRITDIVEKPAPEDAPSSYAVLGRYVFTPGIFDALARVAPGAGGEIQLTDAIGLLLATEEVLGYTFVDGRYDVGNKLDYLRATVELALAREDLGPAFRAWLAQYVRDEGIV
jgi:UTP--glucose-1-phosphate uridylyltransferase